MSRRTTAKSPIPSGSALPAPPESPPASPRGEIIPPPALGDTRGGDSPSDAQSIPVPIRDETENPFLSEKRISYLLSMASSPANISDTPVQFRDIWRLPADERNQWKRACEDELEALRQRDVFELVELPKGRKTIKNRWVFATKSDGRKKARLVAKGFSQVEGVDYDEIFSPVVRYETIRIILALTALEKLHITGLDVKSAFLYGELEEEIYMSQPEGFVTKGQEHKVLRLKRAMYGLKQAALQWWKAVKRTMLLMGFHPVVSDAGLFVKHDNGVMILAVIYVDDKFFASSSKTLAHKYKAEFMTHWEARDLGEVSEYLGMTITRSDGNVKIDQKLYLEKVLSRFRMADCKPATTPLPENYKPLTIMNQ
jgi:hypothetical protein